MPTTPAYTIVRDNCRASMVAVGAPLSRANLSRLATQYEDAYRRNRASRRPAAPHLLLGMLRTARAFHSLARNVSGL